MIIFLTWAFGAFVIGILYAMAGAFTYRVLRKMHGYPTSSRDKIFCGCCGSNNGTPIPLRKLTKRIHRTLCNHCTQRCGDYIIACWWIPCVPYWALKNVVVMSYQKIACPIGRHVIAVPFTSAMKAVSGVK